MGHLNKLSSFFDLKHKQFWIYQLPFLFIGYYTIFKSVVKSFSNILNVLQTHM